MISKKLYSANGNTNRFLSDFIIRSDQYARPYAYIFDDSLAADGSQDTLQSTGSVWNFPNNLYRRGADIPQSIDLVTSDKWDVVDNSVLFYSSPLSGTRVWLEVATAAEEFGGTLTAPSVERAENAASEAEESALAAKGYRDTTKVYRDDVIEAESSISPYYNSIAATGANIGSIVALEANYDEIKTVSEQANFGLFNAINLSANVIGVDATIATGQNGVSFGDMTIAEGVTVTIEEGSSWAIL